LRSKDTVDSGKQLLIKNQKYKNYMTNAEQIKGIVERLGALRRYL
jgi:hypothetical protein